MRPHVENGGGVRTVKPGMVAGGAQDPDLVDGIAGTSGYVSLRSSHLQVLSLSALEKGELWCLGIENAFLEADGFTRDVFARVPTEKETIQRMPFLGIECSSVRFGRFPRSFSPVSAEAPC